MRLHELRLTAFGPFGTTQRIDFDDLSRAGLFLLHGPTGAGKTSVLDAVCYALYGSVPGARHSPQGANLRSDHAEPGTVTEVSLALTVAGRRLEVTRRPSWARPKKRGSGTTTEKAYSALRAHQDGAWKDLSRSHQEIGEEIGQLLGMSKEQFCQVVLLPQGDFARFLRADAETRGRLLGRLFDTGRFAAVEQRLAERRRAGEQAVRTADTELLALANQMVTAAGDAVESPLPELSPGDPGLGTALLGWAAVARSTAFERLAHTECALTTAESALRAARCALDGAGERHRLQTRFARARERAAALAERTAEHRADALRIESARRADTVAPARELRDEAETRRQRAAGAEAAARTAAGDPDTPVPLDADGLHTAARRAAEELGALESARRAERRAAELAGERDRWQREEAADRELLHDTTSWLDDWDTTRTALHDAIDTAQQGLARAEALAGRLESAEGRHAAALQRDLLAAAAVAAEQELRAAHTRANRARHDWLDLREQRLNGIAAELAATLTSGEPCGVCGATEHPHPARKAPGHVDRGAEEAAQTAYRQADAAHTAAGERCARIEGERAAATAAAGDAPVEGLADAVAALRTELATARRTAWGLHAAREALDRAEAEHARRVTAQQEAARRAASRAARREAWEREAAAVEAELTEARGDALSVAARAEALQRRVDALHTAAEAARTAAEAARQLKEADARLSDAAYRAGFDTPDAAAAALLDGPAYRALQQRIDAWQQTDAEVRAVLTDAEALTAAGLPPVDLPAVEHAADRAEQRLRDAASRHAAAVRDREDLTRLSARITAAVRALGPRRAEHDRVARLASLTAGTSAANERRMRLESYVLAARLEQVAAAATVRLARMSQGRYTLVHSDDRSGRGRSGLGLHVVDAWTGRARDTSTLSGGETFFASLALALGLADVVTDEAGGVRLDTLFIDEGFGSLDDQSLDEVLDVLDSLRERDRSVGIVSHVPDLRRRVHAQLEVVKGRGGSRVRQRSGGR
ncbi:SMC family ATPase [Streptomyces sp. NPDC049906]|uniref:SMC family ATPase n=1 Tax=Streptomyces sp. NPDC049906 TaxID=3155656 RepID=UPI0034121B97